MNDIYCGGREKRRCVSKGGIREDFSIWEGFCKMNEIFLDGVGVGSKMIIKYVVCLCVCVGGN